MVKNNIDKWCPNGCGKTMERTRETKYFNNSKYSWIYECSECGYKSTIPELELYWNGGTLSEYKKARIGLYNEM